jgi:uncharacterized protein (DUF2336 family)
MIVRQLLAWARSAPPDHRAEAAAGLAALVEKAGTERQARTQ